MAGTNENLFKVDQSSQPLAERCRPQTLQEVVGHKPVIGPQSALSRQLKNDYLPSIIFWGPPGVGKTTLAYLLAKEVNSLFKAISAVTAGVRDVKRIIEKAEEQLAYYQKRTVLFIDEIHRFNKSQQDALLHAVESGLLTLIGATTENPSFEINAPLLSRCQVIQLQPLSSKDLKQIALRAMERDGLLRQYEIRFEDLDQLLLYGGGDARRMLNLLESAFYLAPKRGRKVRITKEMLQKAAEQNPLYYDKKGEYHYDTISAFIKSVRGSDADAAVYWLAVMLQGGEDPTFIARRLIVLASEDIGNAEPYALSLANAGFEAVKNIGMPEARIVLSQVTTYLASVPKSNAAYRAIDSALDEIDKNGVKPVPLHLRNAPTKLMKELKYGTGYRYPHSFEGHYVKQQYLPRGLEGSSFYQPTDQGREARLKSYLQELKQNKEK